MGRTAELTTQNVGMAKTRRRLLILSLVVALPVFLFLIYTWITLHFAYSTGERTGYVQKVSRKGWICKTWEGELAMTTVPGTAPQIFAFSIRDDDVAHRVAQASGQRVALAYAQHRGVPGACFGETEYFITGVRPVGP
jgi:hypothetical protein